MRVVVATAVIWRERRFMYEEAPGFRPYPHTTEVVDSLGLRAS